MSKESEFTVFCMECYKEHRNLTGCEVLNHFEKYNLFDYLYEFFDVLHTTGENYINCDIDGFLKVRGANLDNLSGIK